MDSERDDARKKTQMQADKMLEASRKRFGVAKVGDTVLLAIPDLDRGRCEFPHLTAIRGLLRNSENRTKIVGIYSFPLF